MVHDVDEDDSHEDENQGRCQNPSPHKQKMLIHHLQIIIHQIISLDLIYTPRQLSSILIIVRIVAGGDIYSFVEFNFVKDFKVL